MPTGATNVTVTNEALQAISAQTQITALNDGSPAAKAATVLYVPVVELLLRELDPAFARYTVALTLSGAVAPVPPWAYEYVYPTDCLRLRQVRPPASGTGSLADPNDPTPVLANVAFDIIAATPTKVILSNQQNALAVYTTSQVTEAQWDGVFMDAAVRRLGSYLAMSLSGRSEAAMQLLQSSAQMAQTTEAVDEGGFRRF